MHRAGENHLSIVSDEQSRTEVTTFILVAVTSVDINSKYLLLTKLFKGLTHALPRLPSTFNARYQSLLSSYFFSVLSAVVLYAKYVLSNI